MYPLLRVKVAYLAIYRLLYLALFQIVHFLVIFKDKLGVVRWLILWAVQRLKVLVRQRPVYCYPLIRIKYQELSKQIYALRKIFGKHLR